MCQFIKIRGINPVAEPGFVLKFFLVGPDRVQNHLITDHDEKVRLLSDQRLARKERYRTGCHCGGGSACNLHEIPSVHCHFRYPVSVPLVAARASICIPDR